MSARVTGLPASARVERPRLAIGRPTRAQVSFASAAIVWIVATVVMIGWLTGNVSLTTLGVWPIPVRMNAALGLWLISGAALIGHRPGGRKATVVARVLIVAGGIIGVLTVAEFWMAADFGIDTILVRVPTTADDPFADRMSLSAAVGITLSAIAVFATTLRSDRYRLAVIVGSLTALLGGTALMGHLYAASELLSGWSAGTNIAVPTAICLCLLGASVISHPSVHGFHDVLARRTRGGLVARSLILFGMVLLPGIGWLRLLGQERGYFGTGIGITLMVAISGGALALVGTLLGGWLDRADQAKGKAERLVAQLFELASDPMCIVDGAGRFIELNPAWVSMLGYPVDALRGTRFIDLVHPDDLPATLQEFAEVGAGHPARAFTNRYRHADGSYRDVEWNSQVEGATGNVFAVARDVTERAAERRLHALAAAVLTSTGDAVVSTDLDGTILTWNPAAEAMFGWTGKEAIGRPVTFLVPQDRQSEATERLAQIHAGTEVRDWTSVRVTRGGMAVDVQITSTPLRDVDSQVIGSTAVFRNLSAIVAASRRLELANGALADRNRELRDFASVVSHDLRAPLRRLQMFTDMAINLPGSPAEVSDLLGRMAASAHSMESLVIDLLGYARLGMSGVEMRTMDLSPVVADAIDDQLVAIQASHAIVHVGALPSVECDPLLMRQLFSNLIGNAMKFHREATTPEISIDAVMMPASGLEGATVTVTVRDNGIGFDPAYSERIFGIFERLDVSSTNGTGVGLAICRKIAALHGGTIHATSEVGKGSAFIITIPVTQPKDSDHESQD